MRQITDKYSLWAVPRGEAGEKLQALTNKLAYEYNAPLFVPHLTLVANIFADGSEVNDISARVSQLVKGLSSFTVRLTSFGYLDEEFRCLYLLAEGSALRSVYQDITIYFPQVADEHFKDIPHISVLYGNYSDATKRNIIDLNPTGAIEFTVDSFDLFLTNSPVENWRLIRSFPLTANEF